LEPGQHGEQNELIDDLVRRVSERRVTALLGPRRHGKTTALRAVVDRLSESVTAVWLDLYALASWADLAGRLDRSLAEIGAVGSPNVTELAARLNLPLGMLAIELRKPAQQRPDPLLIVQSQLDILVKASRSQPIVLVIDEFSGIVGVDGAAAQLRTSLQHHFQEIGLLFAGSEPSTMQMLFTEPFYAQADLVEARPFDLAAVERIVRRGFESTGRSAGSIAPAIASITVGHPHRVMELADAVWSRVPVGATALDDDVTHAVDGVLRAESAGLERLFSSFPTSEQLVLRVVAKDEAFFGGYADSLGLSSGGAQHARASLVDRGHLRKLDRAVSIVDPVLAEWIRRRFG
jgi:hypothetical protein